MELQPCPFCGDYDPEVAESSVPNIHGGHKHAVYCNACFCEGPTADSEAEAIAAWNRRASRASRVGAQGGEPTLVYEVSNKTSSALFATMEDARQYAGSFPGSICGGMSITNRHVLGAAPASPTAAGPMTEEQVIELHKQHMTAHVGWMAFARAIEAAHGITSVGSVSTEGEVS